MCEAEDGPSILLDAGGEVLHVSPLARSLLGSRACDLVGKSFVRLVVWADRPNVIAWLGGSSVGDHVVFGVQKRGGTLGTVVGIGSPLPVVPGEPIMVRFIEADSSDAIVDSGLVLERLRAEAEELARHNEELFSFAFAAAHDLRAPLMSISAAAQGLSHAAGADLSEPAQALLGHLLHGIGEMSKMVDASLRCSRAGSGLRFETVDCDELLASVLECLGTPLDDVGATLEAEPLGQVIADRDQLGSVFQNVVENALNYRRADRPLHISITSDEGPVARTFCVADNGLGIDPADRERVFRMFERLDRTKPGSGIGLAFCQRVIDAHGGRIWITGNERGGSSAWFTLPR